VHAYFIFNKLLHGEYANMLTWISQACMPCFSRCQCFCYAMVSARGYALFSCIFLPNIVT